LAPRDRARPDINTAAMIERLQAIMADDVGPFRTGRRLEHALEVFGEMSQALGDHPGGDGAFDMQRLEWFDFRNMLLAARSVAEAALRRTESRGAHQREDFPGLLPQWNVNQAIRWSEGTLGIANVPTVEQAAAQ